MNKMMPLLCAGIACLSLTGCSLQEGNSEYPGEQCYLNKSRGMGRICPTTCCCGRDGKGNTSRGS